MIELNYLDKITIDYQEIERVLKSNKLKFYNHKDDYVENFNFEPNYFVYSFYDFIVEKNQIPSQKEFAKYYIEKNYKFLKTKFLTHHKLKKEYLLKTLIYRLFRVYPSFIRDLHFSIYLKTKMISRDIYYNPYLDVIKGIDVLIDNKYGIHLYTNTKRANYYRNKKYNRHKKDKYIHLNIPINFRNCYKCGDYFLYKENELNFLMQEINKLEKIQI